MCYDTYLCGESCFLNFESFYLREEKMKYARIKFLREKSRRTQAEVAKEITNGEKMKFRCTLP